MMEHIRGDTFDYSGQLGLTVQGVATPNLAGWTGRSQVRTLDGTLIEALTFEWIDDSQSQVHIFSQNDTSSWPLGKAQWDIELTSPAGKRISTKLVTFTIIRDASFDA